MTRQVTTAPAPGARRPASPAEPATTGQRSGTPDTAVHPARRAAEQALAKETILVELPEPIGSVRLPSPQRLAFYGGIAALGAFGIMDWPVALVIGIGHLLADDHHHKILANFGEALAEA